MLTYANGLNQIAKQAHWLEAKGNIRGSDRLRIMLEEHNCCSECGATQACNPSLCITVYVYYRQGKRGT